MKANELKKGMVFHWEGQSILVKKIQVQTASSRSGNTLYKVNGVNIVTRQKFERGFKGDDQLDSVEFTRRPVQLLFRDTESCTFMDSETYEQFVVSQESIEDEMLYMTDGMEGLVAMIADGELLGIELPPTIIMEIVECSPGIKGASASARTKPATLRTGLVVQVPEYLAPGEKIKINTESGEYMSRA